MPGSVSCRDKREADRLANEKANCLAELSCPFYNPKRTVMMCEDHWHIVSIAESLVGNC